MSDYVEIKNKDPRWAKPIHVGWMNKFTITVGKLCWRKRFFVLNEDGKLFYFKNDKSKNPSKGFVMVNGKRFRETNVRHCCIEIERKEKPFLFFSEDYKIFNGWMGKLEEVGGLKDMTLYSDDEDELYSEKHSNEIYSFKKKSKQKKEGEGTGFVSPLLSDVCDEDLSSGFTDVSSRRERKKEEKKKLELKETDKSIFNVKFGDLKDLKLCRIGFDGSTIFEGVYEEKTISLHLYKSKSLNDQRNYDNFIYHMRILDYIKHPNILKFHGVTLEEPRVGFLSEHFRKGRTVKEVATKDSITFPQKIEIAKQICDTMIYLHRTVKLVHNNLRWENILLDDNNLPKISGFNLSFLEKDINKNGLEDIVRRQHPSEDGKCIYLSPEVILDDTFSYESDVYSFGIMIYTLIYENFQPYEEIARRDQELEIQIAQNPEMRPMLDKRNMTKYYPLLVHTIAKCWEHDPKKRIAWEGIKHGLENNQNEVSGKIPESEEVEGEGEEEELEIKIETCDNE